jgi:hypothetical protein
MRKTLETISLGSLVVLFGITYQALDGPDPLPARIPTHFDLAGNPNAWGPPATLWFLPGLAVLLYLGITVTALFPSAFHYPVPVTAENRDRLQALSLQMIAWLKVDLTLLFTWIQWSIIGGIRSGRFTLSPAIVPLFLVVIFGTLIGHVVAMFRTTRGGSHP